MRVSAREINYILKYWLVKAYSLASFYEWYYKSFREWYSEQRLSHLYHMQISLPPRFSSRESVADAMASTAIMSITTDPRIWVLCSNWSYLASRQVCI